MRYVGQSYELPIALGEGPVEDLLDRMLQDFHAEHERAYGFAARASGGVRDPAADRGRRDCQAEMNELPGCVESVRKCNTHEVADQISVVEVVPNEDLGLEISRAKGIRKIIAKAALEVISFVSHGESPLRARAFIADSMNFDSWRWMSSSGDRDEFTDIIVALVHRIEMWIDEQERIRAA